MLYQDSEAAILVILEASTVACVSGAVQCRTSA